MRAQKKSDGEEGGGEPSSRNPSDGAIIAMPIKVSQQKFCRAPKLRSERDSKQFFIMAERDKSALAR